MIRTGNPTLSDKVFTGASATSSRGGERTSSGVMTLEGTVNKTLLSIAITMACAYWTWFNGLNPGFMIGCVIAGAIVALVLVFKQNLAPVLTPVYAAVEGLVLGQLSAFAELQVPGVVFQAVSLTFGTLFCLLIAYKSGWIRASENFKLGIVAATGAIALFYLISMILQLFGMQMSFLHDSSPLSIGISLVVVVVAALNLVLDFDFIENAARRGNVPKYMEWYGAFGLLVTLIWLYMEILRLLMKLNSRRD